MAFRKKWIHLLSYNPDIIVIQECEHISKYKAAELIPGCNEFIWIGKNQNKGLGVFSFNDYHISKTDNHNDDFEYILPIKCTGKHEFNLFAIWAMPYLKNKAKSYVGQIWQAVNHYKALFEENSILIGDWNSNAIWDKERKIGNHSAVVNLLAQYDIHSTYHRFENEEHGIEKQPTLYLLKKETMPFHLDYCFVSEAFISEKTSIEIGQYEDWIKWSDHMPVIINNLKV